MSEPKAFPSQNNDLCRRPTEFVQHFSYGGAQHLRNVSPSHIIDMVWLYRSLIPVRRKGGFLLAHGGYYLTSLRLAEGRGRLQPVVC